MMVGRWQGVLDWMFESLAWGETLVKCFNCNPRKGLDPTLTTLKERARP